VGRVCHYLGVSGCEGPEKLKSFDKASVTFLSLGDLKMYHVGRIACALVALATITGNARADGPVHDFLAAFVGTWKVTGSGAGAGLEGTLVVKWGESKACVTTEYRFKLGEDSLVGNHILGFDSATNSFRVLGFFSHGAVEDYHFKKETDAVYRGRYGGSTGGQKREGDLTVTVSQNFMRFKTDGMTLSGKPAPELDVTLKRVQN
jgi:hypothetical protein